jgi:hypothetical protein
MNAALANAAFHVKGVRTRQLPIRIEKLLASPMLRRNARPSPEPKRRTKLSKIEDMTQQTRGGWNDYQD